MKKLTITIEELVSSYMLGQSVAELTREELDQYSMYLISKMSNEQISVFTENTEKQIANLTELSNGDFIVAGNTIYSQQGQKSILENALTKSNVETFVELCELSSKYRKEQEGENQ